MRTQLLHAVPAANPDANCDNGGAINDQCYGPKSLIELLTIAPCASAEQLHADGTNHNRYYLDGYAGI